MKLLTLCNIFCYAAEQKLWINLNLSKWYVCQTSYWTVGAFSPQQKPQQNPEPFIFIFSNSLLRLVPLLLLYRSKRYDFHLITRLVWLSVCLCVCVPVITFVTNWLDLAYAIKWGYYLWQQLNIATLSRLSVSFSISYGPSGQNHILGHNFKTYEQIDTKLIQQVA